MLVHHGIERLQGEALTKAAEAADIVITTYALANRDREQLETVNWHRLVLDEAQNIKNPQAKQTTAVRSLQAERRIALTGTPVENRLTELWSIMEFLNPGFLGTAGDVPARRFGRADRAVPGQEPDPSSSGGWSARSSSGVLKTDPDGGRGPAREAREHVSTAT